MFYSYKEIKTTNSFKAFDPFYKYESTGDVETDNSNIRALEKQRDQCLYVGKKGYLHFYWIPDGYPLIEQDPEIEATPHATLRGIRDIEVDDRLQIRR